MTYTYFITEYLIPEESKRVVIPLAYRVTLIDTLVMLLSPTPGVRLFHSNLRVHI